MTGWTTFIAADAAKALDAVPPELESSVRQLTRMAVVVHARQQANGDVELWATCARCGAALCGQAADGGPVVTVGPDLWSDLAPAPALPVVPVVPVAPVARTSEEAQVLAERQVRRYALLDLVARRFTPALRARCGCAGATAATPSLVYRPASGSASWAVAMWYVGIGQERVHHLLEPELKVAPCDSNDARYLKAVLSGDQSAVTCEQCRALVTRSL